MSILLMLLVSTLLWYILDRYTDLPWYIKWIIVFIVLMML